MGSSLVQGFNYVRLGSDTITVAGTTTLIVDNIPSGYSFLVVYLQFSGATNSLRLQFNDDGAANHYLYQFSLAKHAALTADQTADMFFTIMPAIGSTKPYNVVININQSNTLGDKGITALGGSWEQLNAVGGYWVSAAEISKIVLTSPGGFDAGSNAIVYGVR